MKDPSPEAFKRTLNSWSSCQLRRDTPAVRGPCPLLDTWLKNWRKVEGYNAI